MTKEERKRIEELEEKSRNLQLTEEESMELETLLIKMFDYKRIAKWSVVNQLSKMKNLQEKAKTTILSSSEEKTLVVLLDLAATRNSNEEIRIAKEVITITGNVKEQEARIKKLLEKADSGIITNWERAELLCLERRKKSRISNQQLKAARRLKRVTGEKSRTTIPVEQQVARKEFLQAKLNQLESLTHGEKEEKRRWTINENRRNSNRRLKIKALQESEKKRNLTFKEQEKLKKLLEIENSVNLSKKSKLETASRNNAQRMIADLNQQEARKEFLQEIKKFRNLTENEEKELKSLNDGTKITNNKQGLFNIHQYNRTKLTAEEQVAEIKYLERLEHLDYEQLERLRRWKINKKRRDNSAKKRAQKAAEKEKLIHNILINSINPTREQVPSFNGTINHNSENESIYLNPVSITEEDLLENQSWKETLVNPINETLEDMNALVSDNSKEINDSTFII